VRLFVVTMAVLLAPKLFGYVLLFRDRQLAQRYGGFFRTGLSVLFETVLSALIAPVMMLMQSTVVVSILIGRAVGWSAQHRDDGSIPLPVVIRRHRGHTLFGVVLALAAYAVSPSFLAWMSPVVVGLMLAIPVSAALARPELGRIVRRLGLLVTPEETDPPTVLQRANELASELTAQHLKIDGALKWVTCDPQLHALHTAMLPVVSERRKGEYDVDLLLGMAKLDDAADLEEASALLSSREKLAVLDNRVGLERLDQLATARQGTHRV
jgi:membrane glycosyltransferase